MFKRCYVRLHENVPKSHGRRNIFADSDFVTELAVDSELIIPQNVVKFLENLKITLPMVFIRPVIKLDIVM